jgi:hypothetical protein
LKGLADAGDEGEGLYFDFGRGLGLADFMGVVTPDAGCESWTVAVSDDAPRNVAEPVMKVTVFDGDDS